MGATPRSGARPALGEVAVAGAAGAELLLQVSGERLIGVLPAAVVTYLVLAHRDRQPVLAMAGFCALFCFEALVLGVAEQITALLVWAAVACAVGRLPLRRALVGLVLGFLPLVVFKVAEPGRDWLDFAPSTALLVLAAWFVGRVLDRRASEPRAIDEAVSSSEELANQTAGHDRHARLTVLSGREQEVLELLASGMTNPEIAAALCVSRATVKTHVSHILSKLGVEDRVQAAVLAVGHPRGPEAPPGPSSTTTAQDSGWTDRG